MTSSILRVCNMLLITIFGVLLFSVCVNGITNYKHAIVCERETLNLTCEENQVLDILEANYGRTTESTCKKGRVNNLNCYQEDSLSVVSDICEGQQHCSVKAENNVFQDPCHGIVKYLFVLYRCVNVAKYKSALTCENKSVKLKCGPESVIQIVEANYGRRSKFICTDGPIKTTHCPNRNSVAIISNICKDKRECLIHASNSIFGDPCYGTIKYLSVKYQCIPAIDINNGDELSPIEAIENLFHCVNGSSISEDLVCDGIRDCPLGDDEFICNYMSKTACEGNNLEIKCNKNEKIQIINSNYGRLTKNICPKNNLDKKTNCKELNSVNVLRKKCNDKTKCEIKAENKVFGDPCVNTYKYLEAHYDCIPDGKDSQIIKPRSVND